MNFDSVSCLYSSSAHTNNHTHNSINGGYGSGSTSMTICNNLSTVSATSTILANSLGVYSNSSTSSNFTSLSSRKNFSTQKVSSKFTSGKQNGGHLTVNNGSSNLSINNYGGTSCNGQTSGVVHRRNGSVRSNSNLTNNAWRSTELLPPRNPTIITKKSNKSNTSIFY